MHKNKPNIDELLQRYQQMLAVDKIKAKHRIDQQIRRKRRKRLLIEISTVAAAVVLGIFVIDRALQINVTIDNQTGKKVDYYSNRLNIGDESIILQDSFINVQQAEQSLLINSKAYKYAELPTKSHTISCGFGKKLKLLLPDSSIVHLASGSSLTYASDFTMHERCVKLSGQAYFEVKSSLEAPFRVKCGDREVVATGTSFNINSYNADKYEVALLHGVVDLKFNDNFYRLNPGRKAILYSTGELEDTKLNITQTLSWLNNLFIFNGQPLESIMTEVKQWYGIDVLFIDPTYRTMRLEGEISRDISLEKFVEYLSFSSGAQCAVDGSYITIK